jgi:UDP-N-acetylmuramate dehydrogenase
VVVNMLFQEKKSLKNLNTFQIDVNASFYAEPTTEQELLSLFNTVLVKNNPVMVLGSGSNCVFTQDYAGLIIRPNLKGIHLVAEDAQHVYVDVAAGEVWHDFVMYSLKNAWYGLENMALIPGTVGAAPIQNIGAYGVELKDCVTKVYAIDRLTNKKVEIANKDCHFSYRDSMFKSEEKNRYCIIGVQFALYKKPQIKVGYGDIQTELLSQSITEPTPINIANTVIKIRQKKLPDPKVLGNAGSFFKNPTITQEHFLKLQKEYPNIVAYPQNQLVKLAAGWLIEQAGWKGRSLGAVACYEKQALVLVNLGGARGFEVLALAQKIQQDVFGKFQVSLEMEANIF